MRNSFLVLMLGFMAIFIHGTESKAASSWQVPLKNPVLVNSFLQPSSDYSAGHRGVDYLVQDGEPVYAASDGTIRFSGLVVDRNVLSILHGKNLITTLEPVCSMLEPGSKVTAGQMIGRTCFSTTYRSHCGVRKCLHFALKTAEGYLSPLLLIGGLAPSRLLPIKP